MTVCPNHSIINRTMSTLQEAYRNPHAEILRSTKIYLIIYTERKKT